MVSNSEIEKWYEGKSFTSDWTSLNFPTWAELLSARRELSTSVLEIGSWEGRSALFFLNYLPKSRIVCIDTFCGGLDHTSKPEFAEILPHIEARFDANLAEFSERVEKIKAESSIALPQLGISGRRFDVALVDGSHESPDVYSDAVLASSMLVKSGIMIFDDYEWELAEDPLQRPKVGIDAFLTAFASQYFVLERGYQLILEKH